MRSSFSLRQRLRLIVVLLGLPLGLLALLLLRGAFEDLAKIDRDRMALAQLDSLWPHIVATTDPAASSNATPARPSVAERTAEIQDVYGQVQDIIVGSELAAGADPEKARLVLDVIGELPNLILRTQALLADAVMLSGKPMLGPNDRMLFLVDAGQFKVTVERVERALLELVRADRPGLSMALHGPAMRFTTANVQMQSAAAGFAVALSPAASGVVLDRVQLVQADGRLFTAADAVWRSALDQLAKSLGERHADLRIWLWMVGSFVALTAGFALACATALSRSILRRITSLESKIRGLGDHGLDAVIDDVTAEDEIGRIARAVAHFRDRTVETITAMLTDEKRRELALLFAASPVPMMLRDDATGRVVDANEAASSLFDQPLQDLGSWGSRELGFGVSDDAAPKDNGGPRTVHHRRSDGTSIELLAFEKTIRLAEGSLQLVALVDLTERREAEARIAYMAHHDAVTGLPNRTSFQERLAQEVTASGRLRQGIAVLALGLDRFKEVNDTLGHPFGDALLRAVAVRLDHDRAEDVALARLGGDEFALIQTLCAGPDGAAELARDLLDRLSLPFDIDGHCVQIGASIGIALSADDGIPAEGLLKRADLALHGAKADERGSYRFFEPAMNDRLQARREIEAGLRVALADGQLELHFQPLVRLADGGLQAFEALLRWRHPTRGLIPPDKFIPLAEEIGLIHSIGAWVLHEACTTAAKWPSSVRIAVNVSAVQFKDPSTLLADVRSALERSGLDARRLEIEITEGVLIADADATLAALHRLRELGVRIALDDFGTGYSSLSYLRSFPFDKIKIDRSFICGIGTDPSAVAIIKAICELAAALGITTTVEGVETIQQLDAIRGQGCHEVQGYLLGRPAPADQDARLLYAKIVTRDATCRPEAEQFAADKTGRSTVSIRRRRPHLGSGPTQGHQIMIGR